MSRLQDDAFADAVEGKFAHAFEFRRYRHVDDFSFRGVPEFLHELQIDRAERIRRLYAETFRRDERSLQMNAENFGAFFFAHGRGNGFDVFYHFVARGGIESRNK